MAVALDMNRGHISDIEQGKREVGIITLQVSARALARKATASSSLGASASKDSSSSSDAIGSTQSRCNLHIHKNVPGRHISGTSKDSAFGRG